MGADNWRVCPQCSKSVNEQVKKLEDEVKAKYGKIPINDWENLRATSINPHSGEETLREDYEIGTHEDGSFDIFYSCKCSVCGYGHKFKHTDPAPKEAKPCR